MKRLALTLLAATLLAACEVKPITPAAAPSAPPEPTQPLAAPGSPAPAKTPGLVTAIPPPAPPKPTAFRGLWVTRYDFRSPDDIRRAINEAAAIGTTDIIWQARGQADAFYQSALEPWGRELFRELQSDATSPGFDPLKLATDLAHERGMRLHAWVNVMPLWKGMTPPSDPRHPFNAHPKWRLADDKGKPQPLNEHYVIVNPVLVEVQDHIVAVMRDIVTRYPVDGIHLDYVRFVSEKMEGGGALLPGDPTSMAMFRAASGRAGLKTPADKAAFQEWKRDRISDLVHRIREEAVAARPGVVLTAAVWNRPEVARDQYLQDSALWLNEQSIDRAMPMIYTDKDDVFENNVKAWITACPTRPVTPGVASYMHAIGQTPRQLQTAMSLCKDNGYCLFSYAANFETVDPSQRRDEKAVTERLQRRNSIETWVHSTFPETAPKPPAPDATNPAPK